LNIKWSLDVGKAEKVWFLPGLGLKGSYKLMYCLNGIRWVDICLCLADKFLSLGLVCSDICYDDDTLLVIGLMIMGGLVSWSGIRDVLFMKDIKKGSLLKTFSSVWIILSRIIM
nr:hypothetical protein [Tanacetum cinerariifolium]